MTKRQSTGKRLRFEVFKRDYFTCQYCGAQPPAVVLVVDHIVPVAADGPTAAENLVTACEACNQGKAHKEIHERLVRPDADLMRLEVEQEAAELRRFREAIEEREVEIAATVNLLQYEFRNITGEDWVPADWILRQMLGKYSAEIVHQGVLIVAPRVADGYILNPWTPYLWAVLGKLSREREGAE